MLYRVSVAAPSVPYLYGVLRNVCMYLTGTMVQGSRDPGCDLSSLTEYGVLVVRYSVKSSRLPLVQIVYLMQYMVESGY